MALEYSARNYSGDAPATTLNGGITNNGTTITLTSGTGYPTSNFGIIIDANTTSEEHVWVGSRSGTSCTSCTRGADNTSGVTHASGAAVIHGLFAQDAAEANAVASAMTTKGDLPTRNNTATAAPQRLAVGANNTVLMADSAQTLGLKYSTIGPTNLTSGNKLIRKYATTAARDSDITSPVDGDMAYIGAGDSTEGTTWYNGTAWRAPWNMPWGLITIATVTSNQGSITTAVDLTSLTVTFTAVAHRRYRVTGNALGQSTVATDTLVLQITDGSNTLLQQGNGAVNTTATNVTLNAEVILSPAAGSTTWKLRSQRTGSGTMTMAAGATFPAFISVEDIGPNGAPA